MNPSDEGDDSSLRCYPSWRQSLLNKLVPRLWHCVEGANADLLAWILVSALDQIRSGQVTGGLLCPSTWSLFLPGTRWGSPASLSGERCLSSWNHPLHLQRVWQPWRGTVSSEGGLPQANQPPAAMDLDLPPYADLGV